MEKKWLILIVVLIIVIFIAYWFFTRKAKYAPNDYDAEKTVKMINKQNSDPSYIFNDEEFQRQSRYTDTQFINNI